MPFMRLSIPSGKTFKLGSRESYGELLNRLIDKAKHVEVLESGEYNLTPATAKLAGEEKLIVHDNDTATLVDTPPQGSVLLDKTDEAFTLEPSANKRSLPAEDTLVAIATPIDEDHIQLFEVVKYVAG